MGSHLHQWDGEMSVAFFFFLFFFLLFFFGGGVGGGGGLVFCFVSKFNDSVCIARECD